MLTNGYHPLPAKSFSWRWFTERVCKGKSWCNTLHHWGCISVAWFQRELYIYNFTASCQNQSHSSLVMSPPFITMGSCFSLSLEICWWTGAGEPPWHVLRGQSCESVKKKFDIHRQEKCWPKEDFPSPTISFRCTPKRIWKKTDAWMHMMPLLTKIVLQFYSFSQANATSSFATAVPLDCPGEWILCNHPKDLWHLQITAPSYNV